MARHRHSLSTTELQASLQYAQTYLATDGAAEAFARRRGLRISVAEEAKERRKRIEVEMALLSPHHKSQHSAQIAEQLTRLKAEWRKASADERAASQALKSPSLVGPPTPSLGALPSLQAPPRPLGAHRHSFQLPRRPSSPASSSSSHIDSPPPYRPLLSDTSSPRDDLPAGLIITSHSQIPGCSAQAIRRVGAQAADLRGLKMLLREEGMKLGADAVMGVQVRQGRCGMVEGEGVAVRLRR